MEALALDSSRALKTARTKGLVGIGFVLGAASLPFARWVHASQDIEHEVINEGVYWACVIALLLYVRFIERRPMSSVGFRRPTLKDLGASVGGGVLIIACLAGMYYFVFPLLHWSENQQVGDIQQLPYWLNVIIVLRAAVSEELFYRSYSIERIQELTGNKFLAGVVPCTVFTALHIGFWGWHHVFIAGLAGIILTLLYIWRRNVWTNMIAHFLVDATAFLA